MKFLLSYKPYTLRFRFDARTSRGAMTTHQVYFLVLSDEETQEKFGIGECAPLPGLSPEADNIESILTAFVDEFNAKPPLTFDALDVLISAIDPGKLSSVRFAMETAALDFKNGARRLLFESEFVFRGTGIPINGLVWMGDKAWMREQVKEKISKGFTTIKLKIGALDFAEELAILNWMREEYSEKDLTIRVDANGAFAVPEALQKLEQLAAFRIHSIEQPIKAGQWQEMAELCRKSPIPIALDEELIGNQEHSYKVSLLDQIDPQFIILKPTLHGGLASCADWINLAEERKIGWWMTSALESNIGLNAVSQFTALYHPDLPQGLGTGQLYHNNIASPLCVSNGHLYYTLTEKWGELP